MSLVESKHLISSTELAEITGATFRQIDYWARAGVIRPTVEAEGSGHYRQWDPSIAPLVRLLCRISEALVAGRGRDPELHRRVADCFQAGEIDLGDGVRLVWDPDQVAHQRRAGELAAERAAS